MSFRIWLYVWENWSEIYLIFLVLLFDFLLKDYPMRKTQKILRHKSRKMMDEEGTQVWRWKIKWMALWHTHHFSIILDLFQVIYWLDRHIFHVYGLLFLSRFGMISREMYFFSFDQFFFLSFVFRQSFIFIKLSVFVCSDFRDVWWKLCTIFFDGQEDFLGGNCLITIIYLNKNLKLKYVDVKWKLKIIGLRWVWRSFSSLSFLCLTFW